MGLTPARGLLQVRPVDTDERLPGAKLVLLAETRERMTAWQCECVAVGAPAICEDEDCERPHLYHAAPLNAWCPTHETDACVVVDKIHACLANLGDWLLVRPRSYIAGPNPNVQEWFVHQDDVLAILEED